jgi:hypothetical protein
MVLGQPEFKNAEQFRPMGRPMFVGLQTYPVACLDCGYVGTCLSEDERSELETKLSHA